MQEENQSQKQNLGIFINKLPKQNLLSVAEYLDYETIERILEACMNQGSPVNEMILFQIIFVKNFIQKHLNYVDRSSYMSFYNQDNFKIIQNKYIRNLWSNGYYGFKKNYQTLQKIRQGLSNIFDGLIDSQQLISQMFQNIRDPLPPELLLKKSNVGLHCNSGFQFYLVHKRFKLSCSNSEGDQISQIQTILLQLRSIQKNNGSISQIFQQQECVDKINQVFSHWYKINSENYQQYLINSKTCYVSIIHNSLVYLITYFDTIIQNIDMYLEAFSEDTFHQFVEFNVRYEIFRHSLLAIQEQFDGLFQCYNEIVKQDLIQSQNSKFVKISVWNCLLSKWYLYMNKRHAQFNEIYCCLLKKLNYQRFLEILQQKQIKIQNHICVQNSFSSCEHEMIDNISLIVDSSLYTFVQQNQSVSQLLKQFLEYIVDLSINQDSVHWCGHSEHQMHVPFQNHEYTIVESLNRYFEKIYRICLKIDNSKGLFCEIINKIFFELDKQYLKPVTLKKLIMRANIKWDDEEQQNMDDYFEKNVMQQENEEVNMSCLANKNSSMSKNSVQKMIDEENIIKGIDFNQRNKRLQHFNCQSNIPFQFNYNQSIVIETEQFESSLKKSSTTKGTLDNLNENINEQQQFLTFFQKTQSCNLVDLN